MSVCVFLGPTLDQSAARAIWDEPCYLPPVRQGDLYAVARRRPAAIGIVDGYFKDVPAVWHKEILWAMSEGVHVFGAASMGALRAAELDGFGMEGIGEVYESLRRGEWEDDDEVAVVHAPGELGYRALSEAMVNIRATLERARAEDIVDAAAARRLVELAKVRPYPERSFERLLSDAASHDDLSPTLDALRDWLPNGRVDRKAADARALIETLRERFSEAEAAAPLRVDYRFECTEAWQHVVERAGRSPRTGSAAALALESIKLDGTWRRHARAALLRRVLARPAGGQDVGSETIDLERLAPAGDMLRRTHGLWRADALADWKAANGLDERDHIELLESETRVRGAASSAASLDAEIVMELQVQDDYAWRLAEATRMRDVLSALVPDWHERSALEGRPSLHALLLDSGIAVDADELQAHALESGFVDVAAFRRALLHRHWAGRIALESSRVPANEERGAGEAKASPGDGERDR